ncbi:sugar phosphate isomerase/epimerase family protein [Paraglaciecola hydrolytica]|uniref:Xylose isomerase n=1 Tax=Paraglaciecola hydrolytica TaxID=1799789 RepID=A0A136A1B6_9ALTE|nr:sugar phosphate isomerase/epimerase [Paraglaciecola hydrolytica]KXI29014.1 xylose isomerase [Paraglaciecola hydrolytica]
MNRRDFLQNTGIVAAASVLLSKSAVSMASTKNYKMGLQLFTVRDEMAKDPIATLKKVKAMGYQDFELYGFDNEQDSYYGFKSSQFKTILDDLELSASSCHYGFSPYLERSESALVRFVDQCIRGAQALNSPYITWPWIAPEQRTLDNFKRMAGMLNKIGEQVAKAGLGFAYHNHGFEFEEHAKVGGKSGQKGFDILISETDPALVKLQMDMYWVMHSANTTPKKLVEQHPGRFVMWHIKDMDSLSRDYTELGNGSINYLNILPDPAKSGLEYYYIEQGGNFAHSSLESVASSAAYFQTQLKTLI